MKEHIPDGTVDAVITDPPYNIDVADWDNIPRFLDWTKTWLTEAFQILKPGGACYLFTSQQWAAKIEGCVLGVGFIIRNRPVWVYDNGQRQATQGFSMAYEQLFYALKPGENPTFNLDAVRDGVLWTGKRKKRHPNGTVTITEPHPLGRRPVDVWEVPRLTGAIAPGHPSPKPDRLMEIPLLASTNPGDLVVDPFAGTGTTLLVAERYGRDSIGFELNPAYCEIIRRRLAAVQQRMEFA